MQQNKKLEISFFSKYAENDDYNVFTEKTNDKIIDFFIFLGKLHNGMVIADLGCGSGAFTNVLYQRGYKVTGVDLCSELIKKGKKLYPGLDLRVGDVENLQFENECFDAVLLSGILHHLPNPSFCAKEVYRILKPGGVFIAFDPNRRNPFMYLYRDPSSPFYSSNGVTANERPIIAQEISNTFKSIGFTTKIDYLSGLEYRYIASPLVRVLLPIYNFLDKWLFVPQFLAPFRSFVFTTEIK